MGETRPMIKKTGDKSFKTQEMFLKYEAELAHCVGDISIIMFEKNTKGQFFFLQNFCVYMYAMYIIYLCVPYVIDLCLNKQRKTSEKTFRKLIT